MGRLERKARLMAIRRVLFLQVWQKRNTNFYGQGKTIFLIKRRVEIRKSGSPRRSRSGIAGADGQDVRCGNVCLDRWCAGRLRPHEKRGFRDQEDTYGSRKTGISIALYFGIYHSQTLFRENLFVVLSTIERQQGAWQAGIIFKDGDRAIE